MPWVHTTHSCLVIPETDSIEWLNFVHRNNMNEKNESTRENKKKLIIEATMHISSTLLYDDE